MIDKILLFIVAVCITGYLICFVLEFIIAGLVLLCIGYIAIIAYYIRSIKENFK